MPSSIPGHAAPRYPELDRVRLTSDAIRLAVPPRVRGGPAITSLADTAELPWVMEPRGAASRHWAEQACRSAGFEPDVRFETADLQAQIRLIESGNAVALMPDLVWTGRGTTAQLLDLPGDPHRTVFTSVRRSSAQRPAILAAREILAATAASIGGPLGPDDGARPPAVVRPVRASPGSALLLSASHVSYVTAQPGARR